MKIQRRTRQWRPASAIAGVLLAVVALLLAGGRGGSSPSDLLRSATREWRPRDGRITGGLVWTSQDGTSTPIRRKAAASVLLQQTGGRTDPESLRLAAASSLIAGSTSTALAKLTEASRAHRNDAAIWNDLATARLVAAIENGTAADLPLALAAADRAIELDPKLAEARFNRAAILERLGLRTQSRSEWAACLKLDPSGEWSAEAVRRVRQLNAGPDVKSELERALAAHSLGNLEPIRAFVAAHPQEARTSGEGLLFYRWALAEKAGDVAGATQALEQITTISQLLAMRGDRFLSDAVAAATRDPRRRDLLVEAYLAYGTGRGIYGKDLPREAEPHLRRAADLFRKVGSPMAMLSEYFMANTIFDQTRIDEARAVLERLRGAVDSSLYPAMAAQIVWQLALCDSYNGAWSACMTHVREAHMLFERQGETTNRAFVEAILAEAYDRVGRVEEGWEHRVAALDVLSRLPDRSRLAAVLAGAIRAESYRGEFSSALAIAAVATDESVKNGAPHLIAEAHTRRAIVLSQAGARDEAGAAVVEARAVAGKIEDRQLRARAVADLDFVEGSTLRSSNPERAADLLSAAITFYTQQRHQAWLPQTWLELGRVHAAMGNSTLALEDFEEGILETERQRSSIEQNELRSGFFDTAPELFAEAVNLLIARGALEQAYAMAERARARTLYEELGIAISPTRTASASEIRKRLAEGEVVVEYQLLPNGLAIFCLDRTSLTVTRTNVDAVALRAMTSELVTSLRSGRNAAFRSAAAEAWRILIAPVAGRIEGARRLVIVPDRFLYAIPFPALLDVRTNRHLIEQCEIVLSPGGSFAGVAAGPFPKTPVLVIGNPSDGTGERSRLPEAEDEARAIAHLYGETGLFGDQATRKAILEIAPRSAMIHYAGHAVSSDDRNDSQLVLAGSGGEGLLEASEIARLPLHRTSLVVLAACGTLRGNSDRVEGMPSLARAFMAAGVPTVVGTLWDVPDESATALFLAFHRHLKQGMSPAAALRNAQIAEIRSSSPDKNMTWATVSIMGRS